MLRIRLQRVGRRHEPAFRVVLTDSKNSTKSGKTLETLGSYDPRFDKPTINAERVKYWISVGAQPTDTMHNLLISQKIIEGKKINILPRRKSSPKKEEPALAQGASAAEDSGVAALDEAAIIAEEKVSSEAVSAKAENNTTV